MQDPSKKVFLPFKEGKDGMSEAEEPRKPFTYNFRTRATEGTAMDGVNPETLLSIRDTILLLTEDCEVVERAEGLFCAKHETPLKPGRTKCDYLAARLSGNGGEEKSKAQVQQYVNEVLGIRDAKIAKRLTGF